MTTITLANPSTGPSGAYGQMTTVLPDNDFAITKSDTNDFPVPVSVWVGGAGTVRVIAWNKRNLESPTPVDYPVQAGWILPVRVWKVLETGTNATNLRGSY